MAGYYVREEDSQSYYLLEDESGALILEGGDTTIAVPFIDSTTVVYTPSVATHSDARVTQVPVEVVVQGGSFARLTQVPVEVVVQGVSAARLTQEPVEVVVQNTTLSANVFVMSWTVGDPEEVFDPDGG